MFQIALIDKLLHVSVLYTAPLDKQQKTSRYIKIWFIFLFFDGDDCV